MSTGQDQYLSVALDAAQVVGAPFWDTPVEPFNFNQTRLLNLGKDGPAAAKQAKTHDCEGIARLEVYSHPTQPVHCRPLF